MWRYLAPLPSPLLSDCLFGFTPHSYTHSYTHGITDCDSQSHHHHHQLTRNHYRLKWLFLAKPAHMRHFSIMHLEGHNTGNRKSHYGNTVILPVIPRVLLPWYYYCPAEVRSHANLSYGERKARRPGVCLKAPARFPACK